MKLDASKIKTVGQLCATYLAYQRELLRDGDANAIAKLTLRDYTYSLEGQIVPRFGDMTIKAFKRTHAAQFLFKARDEKRAVRANRDLAALASAFNLGMSLGLVDDNPCRGVRRNKERPRTRAVTITEVNDLLALAHDMGGSSLMVSLIAVTVALTGRRRGEVLGLKMTDLTAEGLLVEDVKVKRHGDRLYLVKWSPLLRRVVEMAAALGRKDEGYLFPTRTGTPYTDSGFKCIWNRLMKAYAAKHGDSFRAHDLRALYVSEMLDRGEAPNTHANEATMRKVYDRRRRIEVTPLA